MAPPVMDTTMGNTEAPQTEPLPQVFHPREAHFEGQNHPQTNGYERARKSGGRTSLVIDNGNSLSALLLSYTN